MTSTNRLTACSATSISAGSLGNRVQRPLTTRLESLKVGHGGERPMADLLGLDAGTVAKGRQQLVSKTWSATRCAELVGLPFRSYETIINYINTTTSKRGVTERS